MSPMAPAVALMCMWEELVHSWVLWLHFVIHAAALATLVRGASSAMAVGASLGLRGATCRV